MLAVPLLAGACGQSEATPTIEALQTAEVPTDAGTGADGEEWCTEVGASHHMDESPGAPSPKTAAAQYLARVAADKSGSPVAERLARGLTAIEAKVSGDDGEVGATHEVAADADDDGEDDVFLVFERIESGWAIAQIAVSLPCSDIAE